MLQKGSEVEVWSFGQGRKIGDVVEIASVEVDGKVIGVGEVVGVRSGLMEGQQVLTVAVLA